MHIIDEGRAQTRTSGVAGEVPPTRTVSKRVAQRAKLAFVNSSCGHRSVSAMRRMFYTPLRILIGREGHFEMGAEERGEDGGVRI